MLYIFYVVPDSAWDGSAEYFSMYLYFSVFVFVFVFAFVFVFVFFLFSMLR